MAGLLKAELLSPGSEPDAVEMALAWWNRSRFEWGQTDCFQSVLAHVEFVTGRAFNRPRYSSAIGAGRILRRAGGFERYCHDVMETLGCPTTVNPERGDVGLIELPQDGHGHGGLTFCLCTGQKWAARAEARAVLIIQAEPIAAWRVIAGGDPCPNS